MGFSRRKFIQVCSSAAVAASLPGLATAALSSSAEHIQAIEQTANQVKKSIKAGFGDGFAVREHRQENGLTYASIQHAGSQYLVVSENMFDWKVLSAVA